MLTTVCRWVRWRAMPRKLRLQYPGAIYHIMSEGNRGRVIARDDRDRETFLRALGDACVRYADGSAGRGSSPNGLVALG